MMDYTNTPNVRRIHQESQPLRLVASRVMTQAHALLLTENWQKTRATTGANQARAEYTLEREHYRSTQRGAAFLMFSGYRYSHCWDRERIAKWARGVRLGYSTMALAEYFAFVGDPTAWAQAFYTDGAECKAAALALEAIGEDLDGPL